MQMRWAPKTTTAPRCRSASNESKMERRSIASWPGRRRPSYRNKITEGPFAWLSANSVPNSVVRIRRDNYHALGLGVLHNLAVGRSIHAEVFGMQCLMTRLDTRSTQERRKILVYEKSLAGYRTGIDRYTSIGHVSMLARSTAEIVIEG